MAMAHLRPLRRPLLFGRRAAAQGRTLARRYNPVTQGDGTYLAAKSYSSTGIVGEATLGDFNRDGILNLATADFSTGFVRVSFGNADRSYSSSTTYNGLSTSSTVLQTTM